jgi:undecaprenyl pyrophosphate synthase
MRLKQVMLMTLGCLLLSMTTLSVASEHHGHQLTKNEVKALIVGAKTPDDHMKLASYYKSEAQQQEASAKYHDEMAELYKRNATGKTDMTQHCKQFADEARKAAEASNSMADEQEKIAKELGGNK